MSTVNIKRVVDNIRANTTVYTPIVELVVNSIQAIESAGRRQGTIAIRANRSDQLEIDEGLSDVSGFEVEDNGIGFTEVNRQSFDTLYSDQKMSEGGKGFGRFTCLKYFDDVMVDSVFREGKTTKRRTFAMGKGQDIIVDEKIVDAPKAKAGTKVRLVGLKANKTIDKKLSTIARNLVERLLPHFLAQDACPQIVLSEEDGSEQIRLNDWVSNELAAVIKEVPVQDNTFSLGAGDSQEEFLVRVFKLYFPKNQKSKISLVAHKREVAGSALHSYVPEFEDDFYEKDNSAETGGRNYIVRAYVFGDYLDRYVSLERGGFEFPMDRDLFSPIAQADIEKHSAMIAKEALGTEIYGRQERKKERIQTYVDDEAPWHKDILASMDLSGLSLNPSAEEMESKLQREKFSQEIRIKRDVKRILAEGNLEGQENTVKEIVGKISDASQNDLIHYIAMRRNILDLFGKSLELDDKGKYSSEGMVHDIIFPRQGDSQTTPFLEHNLWIVDERLNFTTYVSSDIHINPEDRPDLIAYNKRIFFRGDNEPSNPITIFEFKKPQRDDFVNPSSDEDPVQQIVRYVNSIRDGKYKTPEGRKILIGANTPFFGFVVCDLTTKVETWLDREKDFKPMPDRLGWFNWFANINLYVEVVSWDKVLKDAKMRNQVFFNKLGI